jgi:2-polyprenyl-6-methoxyphenol hydroxylase-like FAD-dependent oxidoreductase
MRVPAPGMIVHGRAGAETGARMATAVVVGAGIGGLASALALRGAGWSVSVLERADEFRPAGAALVLWPNAVRALRALRVAEPVLARAVPNGLMLGRRPDGRVLTRVDLGALAEQLGEPVVTVHRGDLHDALLTAVGPVPVHTGVEVTDLAPGADGRPTVRAIDRTGGGSGRGSGRPGAEVSWAADLVVAADGVHSALRSQLASSCRVLTADCVAWRAVVPSERAPVLDAGGETLGVGRRFGCASLGPRGVYWYATLPGPVRDESPDVQLDRLRAVLRDWHPPIPALLAGTEPADLLHHPVQELWPLPRQLHRRVGAGAAVLVGDAAHAMTPNLGQGACLALEDAATLGAVLPAVGPGPDLATALERYHELRYRRVARLSRLSRRTGRALELRRPTAVWLRDMFAAALPDALVARAAAAPTRWYPPAAPGPLPAGGELGGQ